eukprot:CAMPEP_0168587814 /NCGR_PEP_ID=MMETSP0420-20121227/5090_1 /TAXON_ID=498008 /ORGANISM="Pessonella sp." /LENGTH=37 /DNA_ID= /DNA_START= /DNA_END= /DNA_ORIENTATION=
MKALCVVDKYNTLNAESDKPNNNVVMYGARKCNELNS